MKKFLVAIAMAGLITSAYADIQAPPKSKFTPTRKLSRGIANILYGWTEVPVTVWRENESGAQASEWLTYGVIRGIERTGARFAFGLYEIVNFNRPLYKDTFRPHYTGLNFDPVHGYEEFPPQLGGLSTVEYTRGRSW